MALTPAERSRRWRERNPEKLRELRQRTAARRAEYDRRYTVMQRYGLTLDQVNTIFVRQGERCAICGSAIPGGRGDWHVDHCHETGTIRGLLCASCNIGLGCFKDDPVRVERAHRYLHGLNEASDIVPLAPGQRREALRSFATAQPRPVGRPGHLPKPDHPTKETT